MGKALSDGKADGASTITTSGLTFRIPWTEPPVIRASGISIFPITWIWSGAPLKFKSGLPRAWISGRLTNWKFFPVNWPSIPTIFRSLIRKAAFPFNVPGPDRRTRESTRMRPSLKAPRRARSWRRIPRAGRSAAGFRKFEGPSRDRLFPGTPGRQVPLQFPATGADGLGKEGGHQAALPQCSRQRGLNRAGRPHSQRKSGRKGQAKFPRRLPIIIEFQGQISRQGLFLPSDPQVRPVQAGLQIGPVIFPGQRTPGDLQIAGQVPSASPAPLTLDPAACPTLN